MDKLKTSLLAAVLSSFMHYSQADPVITGTYFDGNTSAEFNLTDSEGTTSCFSPDFGTSSTLDTHPTGWASGCALSSTFWLGSAAFIYTGIDPSAITSAELSGTWSTDVSTTPFTITMAGYEDLTAPEPVPEPIPEPNNPPIVNVNSDLSLIYTNKENGADFTLSATKNDSDGISQSGWYENGQKLTLNDMLDLTRQEGTYSFQFKATDTKFATTTKTVNVLIDEVMMYNGLTLDTGTYGVLDKLVSNEVVGSLNTTGVFNKETGEIDSCVAIYDGITPMEFEGNHEYNISYGLSKAQQGIIDVAGFSVFNEDNLQNENQERPDCSGTYDLSTGILSDTIFIPGATPEENEMYFTTFGFINDTELKLLTIEEKLPLNK